MKAIILAGGRGTRLKPYTTSLPKPLMPIGDRPVLELVLLQLKKYGFTDITLAVSHLSELIQAFFGNGFKWGLDLKYSIEDKPLNTVGPLKIMTELPGRFLVMNGDILTDLDLRRVWSSHEDSGALLTVAVTPRDVKTDFGVIEFDSANRVTDFHEKPYCSYHVSMGIYIMDKGILEHIPPDMPFGFDDLVMSLLAKQIPINVFPYDGFWLDIGRPEDYDLANNELLSRINEIVGNAVAI